MSGNVARQWATRVSSCYLTEKFYSLDLFTLQEISRIKNEQHTKVINGSDLPLSSSLVNNRVNNCVGTEEDARKTECPYLILTCFTLSLLPSPPPSLYSHDLCLSHCLTPLWSPFSLVSTQHPLIVHLLVFCHMLENFTKFVHREGNFSGCFSLYLLW